MIFLVTMFAYSFAQPADMTNLKVGTISLGHEEVNALIIVADVDPRKRMRVTDALGPDGLRLMPDWWFPKDIGDANILIAPSLAAAKAGDYQVTLEGDSAVQLSAQLLPSTPLGVPELVRFEVLEGGTSLVWRPVDGALEYSVAIMDNDGKTVTGSEFVTMPEVVLPPIDAANYSVIIRAYDFHYSDDSVDGWPDNPRISEMQFQGPLLPPR